MHCHTRKTMMMGYKLHVMTQATYPEDGANLPNGVYVVKTYTELRDGSRNFSVVLHKITGKPVHLAARRPVAWVVAVNAILEAAPSPEFLRKLDEETVTELLNCARKGSEPQAETANIHVIEEGERVDQEVIVQYTQIVKQHKNFRNLANQDWVRAQSKDPVISNVIKWIQRPKKDHRKLEEYLAGVASDYKKCFYAARQKEFTLQDNLLYLQVTPTNSQDTAPVFVVPTTDRQAAIDSCHHSAGHQGRDRTLSLMKE